MAVKLPWYPIEGTIIFLYDGKTRKGKKINEPAGKMVKTVLSAGFSFHALK